MRRAPSNLYIPITPRIFPLHVFPPIYQFIPKISDQMSFSASLDNFRRLSTLPADVHVVTSGGRSIPAHSSILSFASPVLERKLECPRRLGMYRPAIPILGAPCETVLDFLRFLYAGADGLPPDAAQAVERHGVQLLVLAHSYRVEWLKRLCEEAVGRRVGPHDAVDVMKIARLFDAPRLFRRCLSVAAKGFREVQRSEGWRFIQGHDPRMELEILRFMQEAEQRRNRWRREKSDQEMFMKLSVAMDSLEHICTEGCTEVGPHDGEPPSKSRPPCTSFRTCEALQLLIRHFASCSKKLGGGGGCIHCKRMWQLFRLHSSLCDRADDCCKVPLCRQFKLRAVAERNAKGDDATWRLLVRKVVAAKVMSSLSERKMPANLLEAWEKRCRRNK